MFCAKCGNDLGDSGSKFCPDCGSAAVGEKVSPNDQAITRKTSPAPTNVSYRSLLGIKDILTWALIVSAGAAAVTAAAYWNRASKLQRWLDEYNYQRAFFRDIKRADDFISGAVRVYILIWLATLIILIVFMYKSSSNTKAWTKSERKWTEGWAIGGWFIPIANLVLPFLVIKETWNLSPKISLDKNQVIPQGDNDKFPLAAWWFLLVVGVVGLSGAGQYRDAVFKDKGMENYDWVNSLRVIDIVAAVMMIFLAASAVVLIFVIRTIADRQKVLSELSEEGSLSL